MNRPNKENLGELFEKFCRPEEARAAEEDIFEGDRILAEAATPEPDEELIAAIKAKIDMAVSQRMKTTFRSKVFNAIAVAAVFLLITGIGIKLFERGDITPRIIPTASIMPDSIWESEYLVEDDEHLATLAAEIEQIESDLLATQLGENGSNGSESLTDLEMELMEINGDFWKG